MTTTTQTGRMARTRPTAPTRRAALGIAGAGALATLLAACGPDSSRMPAGVATVVGDQRLEDPPWTATPFLSTHTIELPGVRYLVQELGTTPTLSRTEAVRLFTETPEETGEDSLVHAAEGEVFLLVHLVSMPPIFLPLAAPEGEERTERFLIGDAELDHDLDPMRGLGNGSRFIVASVPEGAGPEDTRLEVTGSGATQVLSLLDGSRLESPFEHLYAQSFTAEPSPIWWERRDAAVVENGPVLAGTVLGVQSPAVRADGTWPEPGNLLLGVHLSTIAPDAGVTETSTLTMLLPDGAEVSAHGDPAEAFAVPPPGQEGARQLAWFEVPHAAETVTLEVHLTATTEAGELDLGVEEVPVTITRRQR